VLIHKNIYSSSTWNQSW